MLDFIPIEIMRDISFMLALFAVFFSIWAHSVVYRDSKIKGLEAELRRKDTTIEELAAELQELKKKKRKKVGS